MTDTHKRTLTKSLIWRVLAFLATLFIAWQFTEDIKTAFEIGIIDIIVKLIGYYLYERVWMNITWGRQVQVQPPTPETPKHG